MGVNSTNVNDAVTRRMEALVDLLKVASEQKTDNSFLEKETTRFHDEFHEMEAELPQEPQEWDSALLDLTKQLEECRQETPEKTALETAEQQTPQVSHSPSRKSARNKSRAKRDRRKSRANAATTPAAAATTAAAVPKSESPPPERPVVPSLVPEEPTPTPEQLARSVPTSPEPPVVAAVAEPPRAPTPEPSKVFTREPPPRIPTPEPLPRAPTPVTEPEPPSQDGGGKPKLDRELSEESEMSYPKIGPGYTDEISVVSELSIPTVVTSLHVDDEEHYHPPAAAAPVPMQHLGTRQPSMGAHQLLEQPRPPSRAMSAELKAPSHRALTGAAAQRIQTRQAVLAHMEQQQAIGAVPRTDATARATGGKIRTTPLTINDFPSLTGNQEQEASYAAARAKPAGGGSNARLSLLRKSTKYAPSVASTASNRLLLNQAQQKKPKRSYGLSPRKKSATNVTAAGEARSLLPRKSATRVDTSSKMDESVLNVNGVLATMGGVDGVLSNMGKDIDEIFGELSKLPEEEEEEQVGDQSNLRSTAKIKYTLSSLGRSLRLQPKEKEKKGPSLLENRQDINWTPIDSTPQTAAPTATTTASSSVKSDPLLIDEDGFIVTNDANPNVFSDPFAPTPPQEDLFASATFDSFFSAPTQRKSAPPALSPPEQDSPSRKRNESRIDAVELATKKRIEMLRLLVEHRERTLNEQDPRRDGDESISIKLDFVEAETMKQIARLRGRLGESRRQLGDC